MGSSMSFYCDHCHYSEDLLLGVGYRFPMEYEEITKNICEGKYGTAWKDLFLSKSRVAVNAEREAYFCPNCGKWENDYNLSLYEPKESAEEDAARSNYVCPWELRGKWKMMRLFVHKCPDCNKRMRYARMNDSPVCPKCGQQGEFDAGTIFWD